MKSKKVIITADDYGMCGFVDDAIVECVNLGTITSFNVIFNMADDVKPPMLEHPASIGMHWCITAGKPVSAPEDIPSLIAENGEFHSLKVFKQKFKKGEIKRDEIVLELNNQYKKFYKLFGAPAYWNTHQNSALISTRAFEIFAKTAKALGIPAMRNFQRVYIDIELLSKKRRFMEIFKNIFADFYFGVIMKKRFKMPDARLFTVKVESKVEFERLVKALHKSRHELIEVVVHPATDTDCRYFGTIAEPRLAEYAFLRDASLPEKFRENGIELVGFDSIK